MGNKYLSNLPTHVVFTVGKRTKTYQARMKGASNKFCSEIVTTSNNCWEDTSIECAVEYIDRAKGC